MKSAVHIEHAEGVKYPQWDETCYGPSRLYPEFSSIEYPMQLSQNNAVYDMVRNTLASMGMDRERFGTAQWNPLSELIAEGQTVLLKPNMVHHRNGNENCGTDCLVTHPSVVRAVLDYVILALRGTGRIILADAPVQSCEFSVLVEELHYDALIDYYAARHVEIALMDLRQLDPAYIRSIDKNARFTAQNQDLVVRLGADSAFCDKEGSEQTAKNLRITNYLPEKMAEYHNAENHMYSVAKAVLSADVVINLPKPKTHRKAGMTASLKNMVGCVAKKECLPHHTKGSKNEQGDEYLQHSVFKSWRTGLQERDDRRLAAGKKRSRWGVLLEIVLYKLSRIQHADEYTEGSWYGNDTLWRTICDICRIVMYADKEGNMKDTPQRKMFILADMIVAGEGEGPLCPSAKPLGVIVGGWQQIAVDHVVASLMGFEAERFPSVANAGYGKRYRLPEDCPNISSNDSAFCGKQEQEIIKCVKRFTPTSGWKEWLEK